MTYVWCSPSFLFPLTTRNRSPLSLSMGPNALHALSIRWRGRGDARAEWDTEKTNIGEDAFRLQQLFFVCFLVSLLNTE